MAETNLSEQIANAAKSPASASIDGNSATARSVGEIVQADKALASRAAVTKAHRGLRFSKIVNPGA